MLDLSTDTQPNQRLNYSDGWNVCELEFNPNQLHYKETVFTLGNGYLGTRGAFEEGYLNDTDATLINGVYDDVAIANTELVNCPNWLPFVIKVDGERFRLDSGEILKYERRLDLRLGIVSRDVRWRSPTGHTLEFHFERFTSLADKHILAIRCQITSIDFEGDVAVEVGLNAEQDTQGVKHWKTLNYGGVDNFIWLQNQTLHSAIQLGMAVKLEVTGENVAPVKVHQVDSPKLQSNFHATPGKTVTFEKIVTVFTSRDTQSPCELALIRLVAAPCYTTLLAAHIATWEKVWQDSDIIIEGDPQAQLSVRYNLFQLLAVAPRHDDRVSIPPKTLSGFAYRGHIFWDTEIFILPFLILTQPDVARNLLTYRYHTLPGARRKAQEAGYSGAMYAWESATTGDEVTPRWVPGAKDGELVRIWCGDIEVHINTDVAYAVWQYWRCTGDDDWMRDYGAEIILDTAVFWESRVEWNLERSCYDIRDVIGPDENHDRVDNNAFTNMMVQWHLQSALALLDWLKQAYPQKASQLIEMLNLETERLKRWALISDRLYLNQDQETGLIEQFEGFFKLIDVNLADYEPRTKSMQGLLGIEETSARQILKQPDVLMLMYLLRDRYNQKTLQANWDYYNPRTDHTYGSSLGPAINAIMACDMNLPTEAYTHFMRSALVDLEDVRRNAAEGIHAASAGGVWQAVVFGFAGIRMTQFGPVACPNLPQSWQRLKFRMQWRNQWYDFDLGPNAVQNNEIIEQSSVEAIVEQVVSQIS
ncbi:glycoside hydrolase family 65 protein [Iningainema tapete]|uniref:Glycoside hydrolase family 65 protein n=1 Tax=Iningainema tapete BLCC-T55 TaxID=2748662 RepID=A0A8J6XIW4_9CYAN|nr:glycoside hydrolase family 65 protein [Iningainema tapete]MBD2772264.1 glycoside hydrolase family 65 protein [Iningainema tapete BLCC-T55]